MASDDPDWCQANLPKHAGSMQVEFCASQHHKLRPTESAAFFDFGTLASSDHVVFLYGTFGYAASFLCQGRAFLPEFVPGATDRLILAKVIRSNYDELDQKPRRITLI